ncbi:hypothetical protein EV122DRAFT_285559 [Schizophyllum commune]
MCTRVDFPRPFLPPTPALDFNVAAAAAALPRHRHHRSPSPWQPSPTSTTLRSAQQRISLPSPISPSLTDLRRRHRPLRATRMLCAARVLRPARPISHQHRACLETTNVDVLPCLRGERDNVGDAYKSASASSLP